MTRPVCVLCEGAMRPLPGRTDVVLCEHCDRGCPHGISSCRKCARALSESPDPAT